MSTTTDHQGHPQRGRGDPAGRDEQPEHHEQPDLGEPGHALGEGPGRGAVRELLVAEHERADVDGGEPGGVNARAGAVGQQSQGQEGQRVEAGRRQRDPAQHPRPGEADRQADQHAGDQLVDDDAGHGGAPYSATAPVEISVTSTTVGASLSPDSPPGADQPLRQRHHPQHREHRGGIGRRRDRAEQDRELPRHPQQVMPGDRDHRDRHRDPDRGQQEAEPHRRPHLPPRGGETTLGQDQRQRAEADRVRDLGVVELDAGAALPERDPHQEVDQQARQPGSRGQPDGQDGQERDRGAHQHERVELVEVEGHEAPSAARGR
ncbi:MAG: hypothetical protein R2740_17390 [Nocardioides sp.]